MSILTDLLPWIGGVILVILAALGVRRGGQRTGRAEKTAEDAGIAATRIEEGRKAGAAAKASGKTPDEILRANDEAWK